MGMMQDSGSLIKEGQSLLTSVIMNVFASLNGLTSVLHCFVPPFSSSETLFVCCLYLCDFFQIMVLVIDFYQLIYLESQLPICDFKYCLWPCDQSHKIESSQPVFSWNSSCIVYTQSFPSLLSVVGMKVQNLSF